jgi:hypothetical protein
MSEWRTIESAPRDGTWVLTFRLHQFGDDPQHINVAMSQGDGWYARTGGYEIWPPSHWMPLPDPPATTSCEGE